jgi:hypothetical protein
LPAAAKGARLHAVVAETHCRWFTVTPPKGLTSFADLRALTAVRFAALYDESASGWRIEAEWRCDSPFLACAVPEALCAMLSEATRRTGCRLLSCRPAFVEAWNAHRTDAGEGAWTALIDADGLSLLPADSYADAVLRRLPLSEAGATPDALDALLDREALLHRRPRPSELRLFGAVPATMNGRRAGITRLTVAQSGRQRRPFWRRRIAMTIDFLPDNWQRRMKLGRAPLALGAVSAVVSCLAIVPLLMPQAPELGDEIARLQTRVSAPNQTRPVSFELPAPAVKAFNHAVAELNIPWRDLFEAVEQATPETVGLLALEPDPASRTLKIEAEAGKPDDMLAYLAGLRQVSPFDDVALISHETNEQDPNRPIRFAVTAHYREQP